MKKVAVLVCAVMVSALWVCCAFGAGSRKADIVFFIDSSISMQDEINGVKTNLAAFSNAMQSSSIDVRFAVVEYREDKGIVTHKPDGTNTWTSDASLVEDVLSTIYADDYDSDTLEALNSILSWRDFREDASRFGFMLSDAIVIDNIHGYVTDDGRRYRFHDNNNDTLDETQAVQDLNARMAGTISSLKAMNMHMSVISSTFLQGAYHDLYTDTGGEFMDITGDYASTMLRIASYIQETIDTDNGNGSNNNNNNSTALPYIPIEAVPYDELYRVITNDDGTRETMLERIARQVNISSSDINVITEDNKHLFGLAPAPEPSAEARQGAGNNEFIAKLNSLTLYSSFQQPGETGYFLGKITVPDSLVKLGLKKDEIGLLSVSQGGSAQTSSLTFRASSTDLFSYFLFKKILGIETNTLEDAGYALFMGPVADKVILYALRIILALLGGGCALAGIGSTGLLAAGGVILLRKFTRKR